MLFILGLISGVIIGLILALFTVVIVTRYRAELTQTFTAAEKVAAPKAQLLMPDTDEGLEISDVVARNAKEGRDTYLSDLI